MDRLVSIEERQLPQGINYGEILDNITRQRLYDRRLKLTKAIPIMWREITLLEDKNQDQVSIYTSQKAVFTEGLHGLIDQIDDILRRDDEHCIAMELANKNAKILSIRHATLVEMPVDIIRKAAEEHEECMKSLNDARMQKQPKHTETRKTSRPKNPREIPSNASAFQKVQQVESEDREASKILKEKG